jgi:hypothetical protein
VSLASLADPLQLLAPRRAGRFLPGQSGNPRGRLPGRRNRATTAAASLLDGEAEALTRKAVELALAGDTMALRLCLERILPPRRERPVTVALPVVEALGDAVRASALLVAAVAAGELAPGEAVAVAKLLEVHLRARELHELEARVTRLEVEAAAR